MSVPAPSSSHSGLYSHPVPSRPHDQSNNNMAMPPNGNGHGGPSSSQMMSPSSSSHGNQQVSSTSPLVVPQPVKIRPPKTYHCRMCDQVCTQHYMAMKQKGPSFSSSTVFEEPKMSMATFMITFPKKSPYYFKGEGTMCCKMPWHYRKSTKQHTTNPL